MCNKLLQLFACGHAKTICVTPCPHAVTTGEQAPPESESGRIRPNPIGACSGGVCEQVSQQGQASANAYTQGARSGTVSPLKHGVQVFSPTEHAVTTTSASPSLMSPSPTANLKLPGPLSATLSRPISTIPLLFTSSSFSVSPTTAFKADPESLYPRPNYCAYTFPRYLPQSRRPCLECFVVGAEWYAERERMMWVYRQDHHGVKEEDLERLCGLEGLKARFGVKE